ncbi:MAG: hypothetical protein D6826_10715 [Alphaproteobacteria bacterium]|nr:MAG: hypothetical protein D6826_10715 [Alphaproteobacteria bacterium]
MVLALLLSIFVVGTGPTPARAQGVTVHRGADIQHVHPDASAADALPIVIRGPALPPPGRAGAAGAYPASAHAGARIEARAGEVIWLLERATGRLGACRMQNTTEFAGRRIRCTVRPLPARLRTLFE